MLCCVVLCCAVLRKGGRGSFLKALGVDSMYRIHCGMLPFESGQGLRLQKSTLHVICPKTTCSIKVSRIYFSAPSHMILKESATDLVGGLCVSICGSLCGVEEDQECRGKS